MTALARVLDQAVSDLTDAGIVDASADAEFLLAQLLGCSRTDLKLRRDRSIDDDVQARFAAWVGERAQRKPLAYVTGEQPFFDFSLHVTPDVLIPRPETEELVERAAAYLATLPGPIDVIDVGAGSGAIAIALSRCANVRSVRAIDVSEKALSVARRNASSAGQPVTFLQASLLEGQPAQSAGLIVANLPYVSRQEMSGLDPEVRWEPELALDGGPDGLDLVRKLIDQSPAVLSPGAALFLEIGWNQGDLVRVYLEQAGAWERVQVHRDLAGHPRIVEARRKGLSWTL